MSRASADGQAPIGVAILAKAPLPGLAKTRLIPHLGAQGAAALQRWLFHRVVATARQAALGPVTVWCAPDVQHPDFAACSADGTVTLRRQPDGDLGERMQRAVAESSTPAGTLIVGTDCPLLDAGHLQQAATALASHDAVVTPAEDGGYVLIGMRQAAPRLFAEVAWSSERVMGQTRQRLSELGWRWTEFAPLWDVDRSSDFDRLLHCLPEAHQFAPRRPLPD